MKAQELRKTRVVEAGHPSIFAILAETGPDLDTLGSADRLAAWAARPSGRARRVRLWRGANPWPLIPRLPQGSPDPARLQAGHGRHRAQDAAGPLRRVARRQALS